MRIKKILIKNYRSCLCTEFKPNDSLSALIGPNGSGKTNVLTAITLLNALLNVRRRRHHPQDPMTTTCTIKVWYDWNGKQIIHTAKVNIDTDERNQDEIISTDETWYMYDVIGTKKRIKLPLAFYYEFSHEKRYYMRTNMERSHRAPMIQILKNSNLNKKAEEAIDAVIDYLLQLKYYSASQFTNPSACPISFEAEGAGRIRRGIGIRGHKKLLYDIFDEYKKNSSGYEQFKSLIGPNGIGLIDDLEFNEIKTASSDYRVMTGGKVRKIEKISLLIIPGFRIGDNKLSPSQLSEGTFKTIALIFYLVTDRSSLLMIEEPEVCVHQGLLESIIELIKVYSTEKQIFISTHSDAVLDSLEIKNIFKVKRDQKKGTVVSSVVKSMNALELNALKDYLHNEGSLGEFWKHGDLESD